MCKQVKSAKKGFKKFHKKSVKTKTKSKMFQKVERIRQARKVQIVFKVNCSGDSCIVALNTTLRLICNIAPLPCCSDSHTPMLRVCLFRYQTLRSPPVSVFTTLVPQSRSGEQHTCCSHSVCLASRVACVRAWSWLSHPRPPDRSQHGVYRGCPAGTHPCAPDAQAVWHRSQSANSCCAGRCVVVRVHSLCIMPSVRFVLCSLTLTKSKKQKKINKLKNVKKRKKFFES